MRAIFGWVSLADIEAFREALKKFAAEGKIRTHEIARKGESNLSPGVRRGGRKAKRPK